MKTSANLKWMETERMGGVEKRQKELSEVKENTGN